MRRIALGLALAIITSSARADKIGDMRAKNPEFSADATLSAFDLERCVIENVNIGKPWVYRQPDRPGEVSLVWDSREFGNTTLLEIKGEKELKLRFWGKNKMWETTLECIRKLSQNHK